jgi:hypothetical protein
LGFHYYLGKWERNCKKLKNYYMSFMCPPKIDSVF